MKPVGWWAHLLRNVFHKGRVERELDAEVGAYVQQLTQEKVAAGMAPDEARRQALVEFGGMEQVKEQVREARAGAMIEQLWQDVRYGLRVLRKSPGFTTVAIVTLALGIGANTAIFSVVHGVLLRPLPYRDPDQLVLLRQSYAQRGLQVMNLSQANFVAYHQQSRSFDRLAAYRWAGYNVSGGSEATRVQGVQVSVDFFDVFEVTPVLGRTFRPGEDAPGRRQLCILSYGMWQREFGGDHNVLGRSLLLNNVPTEVVGVMPAGFAFPGSNAQMWIPLDLSGERRSPYFLRGVGRLKAGVSPAQAQAETTHLLRTLSANDGGFIGSNAPPPADSDLRTDVLRLHEAITGQSRTPLLIVLGAVGLVLLIACANVANLLLGRATSRAREISVRFALGASASRVVRQLMTECLLLGGFGCAAGIALAAASLRVVESLSLTGIPRLNEVKLDAAVLLFAVVTGLLATLLFGLAPAVRANRIGVQAGLRGESRGTATAGSRRTNGVLVATQFAMSLVLLVGTGLLLRSLERLLAVEPGFDSRNLLTLSVFVPPVKDFSYRNPFASPQGEEQAHVIGYLERSVEVVRAVPGVRFAAMGDFPFSDGLESDGTVAEGHEPGPDDVVPVTQIRAAGPGYFRTLGIRLLRGREFVEADREGSLPVAIVDETLARRYWPDGNAVGRRIRFSWDTDQPTWMTIVGVAAGIRDVTLATSAQPSMYVAQAQRPGRLINLMVRTEGDPTSVVGALRAALRTVDPNVPAFSVQTMEENIGVTLFPQKFTGSLLAGFAAVALLLAAVGIYGVTSLDVTSRYRELAIRIALGAQRGEVFGMVLRQGTALAVAGLALGVAGAFAGARLLADLLFEVGTADPLTFVAVPVLLLTVALVACLLPARRATRVDPITALRQE